MDLEPAPPWSAASVAAERARDDASEKLCQYLLQMYAGSKPMMANHLCAIAHYASKGGCAGDKLKKLGFDPNGKSSGAFQKHLDTVLPRISEDTAY